MAGVVELVEASFVTGIDDLSVGVLPVIGEIVELPVIGLA